MRSWIAPVSGIGLTLLISIVHWLSPLEVTSGPRGIVRSKGESHAVIPWDSIRAYQIYELDGERVLELSVKYTPELERLYMPDKIDVKTIEQELRSHLPVRLS